MTIKKKVEWDAEKEAEKEGEEGYQRKWEGGRQGRRRGGVSVVLGRDEGEVEGLRRDRGRERI